MLDILKSLEFKNFVNGYHEKRGSFFKHDTGYYIKKFQPSVELSEEEINDKHGVMKIRNYGYTQFGTPQNYSGLSWFNAVLTAGYFEYDVFNHETMYTVVLGMFWDRGAEKQEPNEDVKLDTWWIARHFSEDSIVYLIENLGIDAVLQWESVLIGNPDRVYKSFARCKQYLDMNFEQRREFRKELRKQVFSTIIIKEHVGEFYDEGELLNGTWKTIEVVDELPS